MGVLDLIFGGYESRLHAPDAIGFSDNGIEAVAQVSRPERGLWIFVLGKSAPHGSEQAYFENMCVQ
jgi:hypothetical protein